MLDCERLHLRQRPTVFTITSTRPTILIDSQADPTKFGSTSACGMFASRPILTDHVALRTGTVVWGIDFN